MAAPKVMPGVFKNNGRSLLSIYMWDRSHEGPGTNPDCQTVWLAYEYAFKLCVALSAKFAVQFCHWLERIKMWNPDTFYISWSSHSFALAKYQQPLEFVGPCQVNKTRYKMCEKVWRGHAYIKTWTAGITCTLQSHWLNHFFCSLNTTPYMRGQIFQLPIASLSKW